MMILQICMLLKNLIKDTPREKKNILKILGFQRIVKKSEKNYIFFAIKGNKLNGEKFIGEAIKNGASVIVCSKKCKIDNSRNILIIRKKKM